MGWIMAGLAVWLVTLAAGIWIGWAIRGEHEDSRAQARDDGGRDAPADPAPRPPLLPFPGQWALEIEADPFQGRTWLDALLEENGVTRDRG